MTSERNTDIEIRLLIEAIYLKYSYDFRNYSGASIKRRILHALRQFDCLTVSALQERVLHDPGMFMQLLQYLTIPVSEMFRDLTTSLPCATKWCRCCVPGLRSRYGSRAAARGRRCIPWPSCCVRKGCLSAPSSTPPTSTRIRWTGPSRGSTRCRACASTKKTTGWPAAVVTLASTTQRPMATPSWTAACAIT